MASYATFADVVAAYELPLPDADKTRIEKLLSWATVRLNALVPSLAARVEAGTVDPELPSSMVTEAVLRVYRNPSGVTQQTTGPFSRSLHRSAARNEIYFEPEDVQALLVDSTGELGIGTFQVGLPCPQGALLGLDVDGRYVYTPERYRGSQP